MRSFINTHLIAGTVLLALGLASSSQAAQNLYSVTGGWKSIRGTGTVNIPTFGTFPKGAQIGGTSGPVGTVGPTRLLVQTTDGVNTAPTVQMPGHLFTFRRNTTTTPNFGNPGRLAGVTIPQVNQLRTNFSGVGPNDPFSMAASGRSGPSVVSYCPGGTQTGMTVFNGGTGFNPNCTAIDGTGTDPISGVGVSHGRLVYTRTAAGINQKGNQFGGIGQQGLIGTGDLAIVFAPIVAPVNTQPPFTGAGQFGWPLLNRPLSTFGLQAEGMAFAQSEPTAMLLSGPGNFIFGSTGASGIVTPAGLGPPLQTTGGGTIVLPPDLQTAWGGPWTTGNVYISVTKNAGAPFVFHQFSLNGSDTRGPNGEGTLQLVSGNVSFTGNSGSTGNRALFQMELTLVPEPATWAAAGAALLALGLCHRVTRRR